MRSFFKIFFASLLAIFIFCLIGFFIVFGIVGSLASKEKPKVAEKSVLYLDLQQQFKEQQDLDPLNELTSSDPNAPGLYDVIRVIRHARDDKKISGIYISGDGNANGFAASNELRSAILDFKTSKKFVVAYADNMTQGSFFVANTAD